MSFESGPTNLQDKAYVLHSRPFKNTSLIIEVFSEQYGRLDLVAKGAKRKDSPYQGLLQPFMSLFLVWGGRSELKTLYKAEGLAQTPELKGEYIYAGFYINELIMYLLHKHEAHPELFARYTNCLIDLGASKDIEVTLRYFELDLLEELGYGASLDILATTGEPVKKETVYYYSPESGIHPIDYEDNSLLKVSGETLLALASRDLMTDTQKHQAKLLLRHILEIQLEGRPIKTRELFMKKKVSV